MAEEAPCFAVVLVEGECSAVEVCGLGVGVSCSVHVSQVGEGLGVVGGVA